jgi:hypothetical protein
MVGQRNIRTNIRTDKHSDTRIFRERVGQRKFRTNIRTDKRSDTRIFRETVGQRKFRTAKTILLLSLMLLVNRQTLNFAFQNISNLLQTTLH